MLPTLSLNNLYAFDQTLFDSAPMPSEDIDQPVLVDTILRNYGEMQVIIPDWSMMRHAINVWFAAHSLQLARLWADYIATYDPLYNKDAYVEETRTPNLLRQSSRDVQTEGETVDAPDNTVSASGSTVSQYKGFNSSSFNDVSKQLPENVTTETGRNVTSGNSFSNENARESETGTETRTRREYGNVGVTMASQLLRDSVSFHRTFNWYDLAAKLWAVDNLVMVY